MNLNTKDIVTRAKQIADLENSDFISYYENLMLLNEQWTTIYQQICNAADNYFIRSVSIANGDYLPEDFYQVASIKDRGGNLLLRGSKSNYEKFSYTYELKNNQIILPEQGSGFVMEYFPKPEFLHTRPDPISIAIPEETSNILDANDTQYVVYDPEGYSVFDISNTAEPVYTVPYIGLKAFLGNNGIMVNESAVDTWIFTSTRLLTEFSLNSGSQPVKRDGEIYYIEQNAADMSYNIKNMLHETVVENIPELELVPNSGQTITFDDNYLYMETNELDNKIVVISLVTGRIQSTLSQAQSNFNIQVFNNKLYFSDLTNVGVMQDLEYLELIETIRNPIALLKVDNRTGFGILSDNDSEIAISSCFNDTELDFPNNLFYTVLAYKLAIRYKIKQNADITLTSYELQEAENQFYNSLNRDNNQPYRIQNVRQRTGFGW